MTWVKRLIMDGFKSYGSKRVELPLTRGFNAVIGPNGSGKSNIVDALLFVLGGLSTKTMRAGALTDLIFAGTPDEKPSLKTRVEMVLNNTDHQIPLNTDEVRISREVRKTGSSVYRLNGKISTRKEIVDLLTLGNIGVHSRNIVLQGEIIHLITQTPQERRELVESVAGITEFDEKRLEAESELAKAQVRYREIDLLLGGLRESRDRLTQEKMEAERYIHLQLEIEKKTALLLAVKTVILKSKLKQLDKRVNNNQKNHISLQQKITGLEIEKVKISEQLLKLDQEHTALQDQELMKLIPLSDKKRAEKIELESKAAFEREKITKYQDEYHELIQKVEDLMKAREQLTPQEARLTEQISELAFLIEEKTDEFGNLRKEQEQIDQTLEKDRIQVRVLNKDLEIKRQQKVESETRIKFLYSNLQKNSDLHSEYISKCKELQNIVNDLENNLNILNKHRIEATESLKQTREQVESYRVQKAVLDNKLKTTLKLLNHTETKKIKHETELQVLRDEKTDEALTASADAILLAAQQGELEFIEAQGPISKMFKFPPELRKLLSTTFPTIMGALVVSNVNIASKLMDYAKRKQLGRLSIIVRDLINPDNTYPTNSIMEYIDCSETDYKLGRYLFGNICLMDRMTEINIDSNIYITPQGEIIDTARAQVIGADTGLTRISDLQNIFIPKLQKTYDDQFQQKLQYEQENKGLFKEIEQLNHQLREGEARINKLTQQDRTIQNDLERSRVQLFEFKNKVTDLNKQDDENKKDLNKLNTIIQEVNAQLPILEENLHKLNESLEGGSRKEIEQHLYQLQDELDELRVDETDLRLEYEKLQTRKNELIEPGIQNGVLRQEELLRQIESAKQQSQNLTQQFHQAEKELSVYISQIENTRNQMTLLTKQRDTQRTAHNSLVEEIAQIINEANQVQLIITKLELEKKQFEGELEEVNRSASRLGTPHHFEPETLSGLEPSILRKDLLEHQREKDVLGSVNLKAPEQYAEIDQRYTMILKKREILSKERKIINETIEELEQKKRSAFFTTFNKLNKHFNELFKRLSPGPDSFAQLILENEQEPFEGGVLLEARPQGKRIKSITSMSGGEKSLAALALLFAIQKVESSPFYVFDEIDAFLDVANVNKVAELLSEQSKDTQILLVTLREPMMALADQLYAVSNINGISCVFGLNLQDILEGKIQLDLEQGDELVDSRI